MHKVLVATESGAMFMVIPASAQPYAGVGAGDYNADSRNTYTSLMAC